MVIHDTTFVIGHRNPDMDSIASALGYAWLLNTIHGAGYTAARAGEINTQTAFALARFQVEAPQLVVDVRPRVEDIVEAVPALRGRPTVLQACEHFAVTRRSVPLLDGDERPRGLLSAIGLFGYLVSTIVGQQAETLQQLLSQPATRLLDAETILLQDSDYLADAIRQIGYVEPDDFLVVDAAGRYRGLCRTGSMLGAHRQKLILVDHNELSQAVAGTAEAELVEVLDHHRVDTIETVVPIRFHVEPVGSCATLVLEQAQAQNLAPPQPLAALLLCGILSDTLIFQSPTTTARDRQAAYRLTQAARLPGDVETAIQTLGGELLAAGAGFGTRSAGEIIQADLKFYDANGQNFAIAQVEVTSFEALAARLPELQAVLGHLLEDKKLTLALLLVTDILRGNSRLVVAGDKVLVGKLPFTHLSDSVLDAPGLVSRKKQLVPLLLAAVQ